MIPTNSKGGFCTVLRRGYEANFWYIFFFVWVNASLKIVTSAVSLGYDFKSIKWYIVPTRPRIGLHTMHPISWPKCDPTPDGSNKVAEVKVSMWHYMIHLSLMYFQLPNKHSYDPFKMYNLFIAIKLCIALHCFFGTASVALRWFPRDTQLAAAARTPCQPETHDS